MYGLIGSFKAKPGQRDALIALMSASSGSMPGCFSYVIARDPADADQIWITEVWDSKESHKASLQLPQVRETIEKAMPIIGAFGMHVETEPVAGVPGH